MKHIRAAFAVPLLVWAVATSRASVLSAYVQASVAAFGIAPSGTAESIAARSTSGNGASCVMRNASTPPALCPTKCSRSKPPTACSSFVSVAIK